jgi:hypothetical protein
MRWKTRAATVSLVLAVGTCTPDAASPFFNVPLVAGVGIRVADGPLLDAVDEARTEWRCVDGEPVLFVVGTVTIRNRGNAPAEGVTLVDRIEHGQLDGEWIHSASGPDTHLSTLEPGETVEYAYQFPLPGWRSSGTYRHVVQVAGVGSANPRHRAPSTQALLFVEPPVNLCAETCTLTAEYWRGQGPDAARPYRNVWPVKSLTLGTSSYSADEVLEILDAAPRAGGDWAMLAQELIAAKLNVAAGADPRDIASVIRAADALIGNHGVRSHWKHGRTAGPATGIARDLAAFNRGAIGPGAC